MSSIARQWVTNGATCSMKTNHVRSLLSVAHIPRNSTAGWFTDGYTLSDEIVAINQPFLALRNHLHGTPAGRAHLSTIYETKLALSFYDRLWCKRNASQILFGYHDAAFALYRAVDAS